VIFLEILYFKIYDNFSFCKPPFSLQFVSHLFVYVFIKSAVCLHYFKTILSYLTKVDIGPFTTKKVLAY